MKEQKASEEAVKYYRLSEVEERNTSKTAWIIVNHNIYDIAKFLDEVRETIDSECC